MNALQDLNQSPATVWTGEAIDQLLARQRAFFESGATREYSFRISQLQRLRQMLQAHEAQLMDALGLDLRKSAHEAYTGEIGILYAEISHTLKHLKSWMRPKRAGTPLALFPSRNRIYAEPYGQVLIIGPWNYPLQLVLAPLIGAMAAGNVAVIKPSELAPATSALVTELIGHTFPQEYIAAVEGGAEVAQLLLARRHNYIFYTGGEAVGRVVARAAAEYLTPITLELGGKSPCIVHADANLDLAARRIVWGKFYNAGQTCVAPDYLLVQQSVKDQLLSRMVHYIHQFFGADPAASPDFGRIISDRHFERLASLLPGAAVVEGGAARREERYIAPTILDGVGLDHPSMAAEIFGPILPVFSFDQLDEAIALVRQRPNPLALYLFTRSRAVECQILRDIPFGGGCVNDTVVHFSNPNLPFGGIGGSGMGGYHGRHSFETFSHHKGVVHSGGWLDPAFRYPPYAGKLGLIRRVLR